MSTHALCLVLAGVLAAPTLAQEEARILAVPGGAQVRLDAAAPVVSEDGGRSWQPLVPYDHELRLHYARFDPLAGEPEVPAALQARADNRLYVVQFHTQPLDGYRHALRGLGVEIHQFLPDQSYLTRMDAATVAKVRELPFVRWVGPFHAAYKLDPQLGADLLAGRVTEAARYDVALVDRNADEPALTAAIVAAGGAVVTVARGDILLEASLPPAAVAAIAGESTVLWIQRSTPIGLDMDNARIQGGANHIEAAGGFTGKGIRGHIMEGIYATHPEFAANTWRGTPINLFDSTPDAHGNATFGVIFARGASAQARGLCPDGQGLWTNYQYVYNNNNRWTLVRDLVNPALTHKVMFQTASWGYSQKTTYDVRSAEMDQIVFDHDLPITQSQSNTGDQRSRPQAWAKNIISVGAHYHYNTADPANDRWNRGGSIGPASDQRIKPDLCAYYDQVYTTYSTSSPSTGYGQFSGTSSATPIVAGHVGLTLEMFTDGLFGYPKAPAWNQRFGFTPHFSTTKALLINTARQYDPAVNTGTTRFNQGWGWPSVGDMYDMRDEMLVVDELDVMSQGAARSYFVWVKPSTAQFRATMVYPDLPAASPYASPHRINDLDLRVVSPSYVTYWGNNGLTTGLVSTPGGSKNSLDTVENVFVRTPQSGVWEVEVRAPLVAQDAHVETAAVDADFALVVSEIGGGRDRSGPTLDLTSASAGQLDLKLAKLPTTWTDGYVLYSLATTRVAATGNLFGLEADQLTLASFAVAASAGNPFHFTNTQSGTTFPNAAYSFPPAIAAVLKGMTLDAVAIFADNGTIVDVSNVSRVTIP